MIFTPVVQDPLLPSAIICDIDGTLAHMNGRSPYDYSKVVEDTVDETIAKLIRTLSRHYEIVLVSGRPDSCVVETRMWLENIAGVKNVPLKMRKK